MSNLVRYNSTDYSKGNFDYLFAVFVLKLVLYSSSKLSYRVINGEEEKAGTLSPKNNIG